MPGNHATMPCGLATARTRDWSAPLPTTVVPLAVLSSSSGNGLKRTTSIEKDIKCSNRGKKVKSDFGAVGAKVEEVSWNDRIDKCYDGKSGAR